jgi:hypothetical protein
MYHFNFTTNAYLIDENTGNVRHHWNRFEHQAMNKPRPLALMIIVFFSLVVMPGQAQTTLVMREGVTVSRSPVRSCQCRSGKIASKRNYS